MAQIIWLPEAADTFEEIVQYLEEEFGEASARKFVKRVYAFLDILAAHPNLGPIENPAEQIRGFVLHRNTTLFYKTEQETIYLLAFFDNRSETRF